MNALRVLFAFGCFFTSHGGVLEVEVRGTTVNGYLCDATGKAAAESMVSDLVLAQALSIRGDAYLVSRGSSCTGVSAPAANTPTPTAPPSTAPPTTVPCTTAPPTTAPPTTAPPTGGDGGVVACTPGASCILPLIGLPGTTVCSPVPMCAFSPGVRRQDEENHRRTGPVKIMVWATVGVPVSSSADAASLSPSSFVPSDAGVLFNSSPGSVAMIAKPNDPNCTFEPTTGYVAVSCAGSVKAADCDVSCATNYSLPITTPSTFLTKTCKNGVFQLSGCYPSGCKLEGATCGASSECCRYSTMTLPLAERQNACRAGSKAKGKASKGKGKAVPAVSTCGPLSLPKTGKMNTRKKAKTIGVAVGVGVGVSALGVATVAFRRRTRTPAGHKPNSAPTTAATSVPVTVRV